MLDKQKINIDGIEYEYSNDYDRLESYEFNSNIKNQVRCSKCFNDVFQISYGSYECIANCKCGHSFTIYDG